MPLLQDTTQPAPSLNLGRRAMSLLGNLWGDQPSAWEQMQAQSAQQREAYARGGVPEMVRTAPPLEQFPVGAAPADLGIGGLLGAIRAYHGSPHQFSKFDINKIGRGEGAQAYGHGLYFAESPDVAKYYQEGLSRGSGGRMYKVDLDVEPEDLLDWDTRFERQPESIRKALASFDDPVVRKQEFQDIGRDVAFTVRPVLAAAPGRAANFGEQYRHLLDSIHFARSGDEAARAINEMQDLISVLGGSNEDWAKLQALKEVTRKIKDVTPAKDMTGREIYWNLVERYGSKEAASAELKKRGIPGLRYYDEFSRRGEGDETRNIVMFSDESIDIVE